MLDIKQIESFYPENLRPFKRNLLREYLQYKMLEVIFTSEFANDLRFMGGTAIRIVHSSARFSEDIDLDNRLLGKDQFEKLADMISRRLSLEGYEAELKNTYKEAFRSSIRIPRILFENGISRHEDERLTIQVDTEPQRFEYVPHSVIINKFDVFVRIHVVPEDILLAQKIACLFTRKRLMGRDFYDIVFLMAKTGPNIDYIREKLAITTKEKLKKEILRKCKDVDFQQLTKDLTPFLMNQADAGKIRDFPDYIKTVEF